MIGLVDRGEIAFRHDMGSHQLAYLLAEAQTPQISLTEDFMTGRPHIDTILVYHPGHPACSGDEAADVM